MPTVSGVDSEKKTREKNRRDGEARRCIEQLYSAQNSFTADDGREFSAPQEGSLGLLALGAVGLAAWRKARARKPTTGEQGEPA